MKQELFSGAIRAKKRPFMKPNSATRPPIYPPSKGSPVYQPPTVPLASLLKPRRKRGTV